MNRLALTALATVLGTGCVVNNSPGGSASSRVDLYWDFVRNAPAQAGGHVVYDHTLTAASAAGVCPESGVDTVRIESWAGTRDVACTGQGAAGWVQGWVVDGLPAGSNAITVTGYRSGVAVYRTTTSVNLGVNEVRSVTLDVPAIAAPAEIYAYLTYATPSVGDYLNCAQANRPNLGFDLYDSSGTRIDSGLVGCSDPLPAIVFQDTLDLDNYRVSIRGYSDQGTTKVFDTVGCTKSFDHFTAQTGAQGITAELQTLPVPACQ